MQVKGQIWVLIVYNMDIKNLGTIQCDKLILGGKEI